MKKSKKILISLCLIIVLLLSFATVAFAASAKYNYSFNIHAATPGTNWHPYVGGSVKSVSHGDTYNWAGTEKVDNPDPIQKYEVVLIQVFSYSFGLHTADGVTRTKYTTLPGTGDYFPRVYKNTAGSYTLIGSGYTYQSW